MEKEFKPYYKDVICQCHKIPAFLHELTQSILVIHAYINGCNERLKTSTLENEHLGEAFSAISKQTEAIGFNIHSLNFNKLLAVWK